MFSQPTMEKLELRLLYLGLTRSAAALNQADGRAPGRWSWSGGRAPGARGGVRAQRQKSVEPENEHRGRRTSVAGEREYAGRMHTAVDRSAAAASAVLRRLVLCRAVGWA